MAPNNAAARIVRPSTKVEIPTITALFYGQPGAGKSTLGNTAAKPLVLDFDRGAHRVLNRRDVYPVNAWADVEMLLREPEVLAPYETLVIDTVGRLLDVLSLKIIQSDGKYGSVGTGLKLQGYGALKSQFAAFIANVRQLGKHIVMLAHDREDKDGDAKMVRPDIQGSSSGEVLKLSDLVGYLHLRNNRRVIDCSPTDAYVGKNPCAWEVLPVPTPTQNPQFLAELLQRCRSHFEAVSEEAAEANATVAAFADATATCETAGDLNGMLESVQSMGAGPAQLQCKALLWRRAKALDCGYDDQRKVFTAPPKAAGNGEQATTEAGEPATKSASRKATAKAQPQDSGNSEQQSLEGAA